MRGYHLSLSLSFGEADEYTPGILVTQFAPLLHNRASQQLGQLSTPLGAGPPPFIFFHLLTVAPSSVFLLVLPRCSPPWFRNMSLLPVCTVRPFYSLVSFFPLSSPSLSILTPPIPCCSPCHDPVRPLYFHQTTSTSTLHVSCFIYSSLSLFQFTLSLSLHVFCHPSRVATTLFSCHRSFLIASTSSPFCYFVLLRLSFAL